jgi:Transglutaminase-like superfamily
VQRKISKFLALSRTERWLFAQSLFLLPVTAAALHLSSFKRISAALARLSPAVADETQDEKTALAQARTTARMVTLAARHGFFNSTCLHRALILWWLLRRRGISSDLRIGVRTETGEFEAHAWVEYRGDPLGDEPNIGERYVAFKQAVIR